jgi:hypothetical protein
MHIAYRSGAAEHAFQMDAACGPILAVIAKTLPREVAAVAQNGTPTRPARTSQGELTVAARAILGQLDADPGLLFAYTVSMEGDGGPAGRSFGRGSGLSGIRLTGAPPDRAFAVRCGPGQCDLVEIAIGPDGRGTEVGTRDLRGQATLETANVGVLRIHRRKSKTRLREELERLLAAVEGWPRGEVEKVVRPHQ